jgi:hypothetical protein
MSIREAIQSNPRMAGGITAGVLLVVVAVILWQVTSTGNGRTIAPTAKAFFTIDDGKTYFTDDATRVPPFTTSQGKVAVRVRLMRCGSNAPFVSHLEKYSDQDKQRIGQRAADSPSSPGNAVFAAAMADNRSVLVKKPLTGDHGWIAYTPTTARAYDAITQAKCPDGSVARPIFPK